MELDSSSAAAASLSEALVSLDAVESSAGSSGPASTTASLATAAASSVTSVRTVAASPDTVAVFCISNCSPTVEIDSDSRDPTSIDLTSSASSVNSGRRTGSTSGIAGVSLVIGASGKAVSSIFDLSATVTSALPLLRSSSTVVSVCNWISASANASGEDLDSVAWVVVSSLTSTSVIFWSNSETSPLSTSSSIPASRGVASVVAEGSVVGGAGTSFSSGCTEDWGWLGTAGLICDGFGILLLLGLLLGGTTEGWSTTSSVGTWKAGLRTKICISRTSRLGMYPRFPRI